MFRLSERLEARLAYREWSLLWTFEPRKETIRA
jgi:hypothetical protein